MRQFCITYTNMLVSKKPGGPNGSANQLNGTQRVSWRWGLRWACTSHVVFVNFTGIWALRTWHFPPRNALPCVSRGVPIEREKPCDGRYRCIERDHRSVGTLLCCDRGHSSKLVSTSRVFFWFRLNSNMFNIFFSMSKFSF